MQENRDYILTALGDPELEIKLREREPSDLQAAYKTAIRLKTLKRQVVPASKEAIKPSKSTSSGQHLRAGRRDYADGGGDQAGY